MSFTQDNRRIAMKTPLGKDVLLLHSFEGEEEISRLFRFNLEMISEDDSISYDAIVEKNVTLRIYLADGTERFWNGHVSRFMQGSRDVEGLTAYRAEFVPWLWFLTQTADCRIFQKKTVPDIIKQIFDDLGFQDYSLRLYGNYVARDYCVQYRETDFQFVSRLMEEEGIFYFHEHEDGKHTLVLGDDPGVYQPCPNQSRVGYAEASGEWQDEDVVVAWRQEQSFLTGKVAITDYNFETPSTDLSVSASGESKYEIYDFPGEYLKRSEGDTLARVRLEEQETPRILANGESVCRDFVTGYTFDLTNHYRSDINKPYLITRIVHHASQGGDFIPGSTADYWDSAFTYKNQFSCIPKSVHFRPARITPRPFVQGCQTAEVVGPAGEEIYTDKYGRVKVQFHWDREGKKDENSSCWMRVSSPWAGKNWGGIEIPRIGQEVIVSFIEGDPDRPIITGRVYHAESMPPYGLPDSKVISGVKSNSTKGGGGYNELIFDDTKGNELIRVHGQYDADTTIEHDKRLLVGNDRSEAIGRDRSLEVGRDKSETVGRDKTIKVGGGHGETIVGSMTITVGSSLTENVMTNYAETVGGAMEITVGGALAISVGGAIAETVGAGKVSTVGGTSTESVGANKTVTVGKKLSETVKGDKLIRVSKNVKEEIKEKYELVIGKEAIVKAKKIQLLAEEEINFKAGGAEIVMKKSGDFLLKGKKINIKGSGDVIIKGSKIKEN